MTTGHTHRVRPASVAREEAVIRRREALVRKPEEAAADLSPTQATSPSMPAEMLQQLHGELGLGFRELARLTGCSEKSLSLWEGGKEPGRAAAQTLRNLYEFVEALSRVMKREAIPAWLERPNPAFGGQKPAQLIETGRMQPLWWMIYDLERGDVV